jgi:hypothetical protein
MNTKICWIYLISGQPGSGKTFLLYHLAKSWNAKFAISQSEEDIIACLRISSYIPVIIIDDAFESQSLIRRLMHFRKESSLQFYIVAVCWPYETEKLLSLLELSSENHYKLSLLSLDTIAEIVKNLFKRAYFNPPSWILNEICLQAFGRPGLAITLTNRIIQENSTSPLLEGQAHFEIIERLLDHSEIEEEKIRLILAAFSVGGNSGMSKETVSQVTGIPLHEMMGLLRKLATGGIIEETGAKTLTTRPAALRHILLKKVFFSGDGFSCEDIYWKLYEASLTKKDSLIALIKAVHKGAKVDDAKLYNEVAKIGTNKLWNELASVNKTWCQKVLQNHKKLCLELANPALHYIPETIIPLLLEKAVDDKRPEHQNPESPIRRLSDWITHFSKQENDAFKRRKILSEKTIDWIHNGGDQRIAWRILPRCVSLIYQNSEVSPNKTWTLSHGLVSIEDAKKIANIWDSIIKIASVYPPCDWDAINNALWGWLHPIVGTVTGSTEFKDFTLSKLKEVIRCLLKLDHIPKNALARWGIENNLFNTHSSIDPDFLMFFPIDNHGESRSELEPKYFEDARVFGQQLASFPPLDVSNKILSFYKESKLFEIRWPCCGNTICSSLANELDNQKIEEWIDIFIKNNIPSECLFPFIKKTVQQNHPNKEKWLLETLELPDYYWEASKLILSDEKLPEYLVRKTFPKLSQYSNVLDVQALRGEIALKWFCLLTELDDKNLLLNILIGDFHSQNKVFLKEKRKLWIKTFRRAIVGLEKLKSEFFYDIDKLIRDIPEIKLDIARELISANDYVFIGHDELYHKLFNEISTEEKITLLPRLKNLFGTSEFISYFVGNDLSVYKALLENPELENHHLAPLLGKPSSLEWRSKALLALEYGKSCSDMATAARGDFWSFSGSAVEFWQNWMNEYDSLCTSENEKLQEIGTLGKKMFQFELDRAKQKEEKERICGFLKDE